MKKHLIQASLAIAGSISLIILLAGEIAEGHTMAEFIGGKIIAALVLVGISKLYDKRPDLFGESLTSKAE